MRLPQGPREGLQQRPRLLAALRDEVGQNFGIGFGFEDIALGEKALLQFLKVFDDAVVDDSQIAVAADMRMGVALGGHAVRGPAGMPDAVDGQRIGIMGKFFLKRRQFPFGLDDVQLAALHEADAG